MLCTCNKQHNRGADAVGTAIPGDIMTPLLYASPADLLSPAMYPYLHQLSSGLALITLTIKDDHAIWNIRV